ncbi:hypothetical protein [Pyxidicoccus xibeiensis]|uniref:hypothetical protein n=1 Tax=Pyxidicoccus xibeiensis TaxID=2906759 RepID=UPI0020A77DAE|nr:hypothetical protein [Pyxidicoccus xibeiensis]MCP3145017.1 hypothetical protein [Pyxidicoccus xibeiensis]
MPEVSGRALMMAIQAVEAQIERLEAEITEAGDDADPDLQLLNLSYWKAAWELEDAYREALEKVSNLPPYEDLVASFRSKRPAKEPETPR